MSKKSHILYFSLWVIVGQSLGFASGIGGGNPMMQLSNISSNYTVKIPAPSNIETLGDSQKITFGLFNAQVTITPMEHGMIQKCRSTKKNKFHCLLEKDPSKQVFEIRLPGSKHYKLIFSGSRLDQKQALINQFIQSFYNIR